MPGMIWQMMIDNICQKASETTAAAAATTATGKKQHNEADRTKTSGIMFTAH